VKHLATLGVPPPQNPRDRVQTGHFLRAVLTRTLLLVIPLWVLVGLLVHATWVLVVGVISVAILAADVVWLNYRLRRDKRRADTG
jgi:hypothetical protein